jgi:hypothetical protein
MNRVMFYGGLFLVLLLAAMTGFETSEESSLDQAVNEQKQIEVKLVTARHVDRMADLLMRRSGIEAEHDPQLAQVLKKHGLNLIVSTREDLPQTIREEVAQAKAKPASRANEAVTPDRTPTSSSQP